MGRPLRTATFTEPKNVSDVVKMEEDGHFCREAYTLKSGFGVLDIGNVLGQITLGAASAAAKSGGNTGNGTFTIDVTTPILAEAQSGIYTARCIAAATNSGTFEIKDPKGRSLGQAVVGATFADQIKFVIADGSSDFVVGDGFDITVAVGSKKWAPYKPGALDGSQYAKAILLHKSDTTADVLQAVMLVRGNAEVSLNALIWDATVTTQAQKDAALASLAAEGIIGRVSA